MACKFIATLSEVYPKGYVFTAIFEATVRVFFFFKFQIGLATVLTSGAVAGNNLYAHGESNMFCHHIPK